MLGFSLFCLELELFAKIKKNRVSTHSQKPEADLRGRGGASALPFLQSLVFCNHFAELEVVLFEVELTINNAPLTYVYSNTKEKCLSPKHLLFGRQLLYSSKKLILLYDM